MKIIRSKWYEWILVCKHTYGKLIKIITPIFQWQYKKRNKQGKKKQEKMWDICEYIAQLMANRVQQSAEISK